MVGYLIAGQAILSAFNSYQQGQISKEAFRHDAAMQALAEKQIGINLAFDNAKRKEQYAETLAMQNVLSAAMGRSGGSLEALSSTGAENLRKDMEIAKSNADISRISAMMGGEIARASGETAARMGLLGGGLELLKGGVQAAPYL